MDAKKLNTGSKDSISLLPQDVLGDILSRLPTKLAASTSVLSKRWRTLFALVNNLDFDDSVFVKPEQCEDAVECFVDFVDRTLALQGDSSIKKFSLTFDNESHGNSQLATVCGWITNVVERGVSEMCLRLYDEDKLPSALYMSKTLVKLTLGRCRFEILPQNVYLPALKSLFIETLLFELTYFCDVLLAGCPVLEELSFLYEDKDDAYPRCICSQTIKKLKVNYNNRFVPWEDTMYMSFDAPNLVSFDYTDVVKTEYKKVNMKSLVEARLDLTYLKVIESPDLTKLIVGISNVQTLHLSPNTVNAISLCCKHGLLLPVFNNLINLSFGSCDKKGWKLLPNLLKQTPNLETLTIQSLDGFTDDVSFGPLQVKVLHVLGYGNTVKEMEHLRNFVWGTKCLELVKVEIKKGCGG